MPDEHQNQEDHHVHTDTLLEWQAAARPFKKRDQSFFLNTTGLDVSSSTAGAYGSALDVAHLVEKLLKEHGSIFEATTRHPISNGESGKGAMSTLEPLWSMPGLIAAKTGFTDLAGGNLAAAIDMGIGQPVIAVVLGSTREGRFEDVQLMVDTLRERQLQYAK